MPLFIRSIALNALLMSLVYTEEERPYVREHRRLEEVSLVQPVTRCSRAAAGDGGALVPPDFHVALDFVESGPVDDRTDVRRGFQAVSQSQRSRAPGKLIREGRRHALVHDHAAGGSAALAARAEGAPDGAFNRKVEVGVVQDDDGVLAAHLQVQALVVAPAVGSDLSAHLE